MTKHSRKVVAVMQDLLFMVQIQDAAKKALIDTVAVKTIPDALAKAAEQPLLMVIDLNDQSIDSMQLIQKLKANPETRSIQLLGFVSHVNVELRQKATDAGCDIVVPRSAFAQKLKEVIAALPPT